MYHADYSLKRLQQYGAWWVYPQSTNIKCESLIGVNLITIDVWRLSVSRAQVADYRARYRHSLTELGRYKRKLITFSPTQKGGGRTNYFIHKQHYIIYSKHRGESDGLTEPYIKNGPFLRSISSFLIVSVSVSPSRRGATMLMTIIRREST